MTSTIVRKRPLGHGAGEKNLKRFPPPHHKPVMTSGRIQVFQLAAREFRNEIGSENT